MISIYIILLVLPSIGGLAVVSSALMGCCFLIEWRRYSRFRGVRNEEREMAYSGGQDSKLVDPLSARRAAMSRDLQRKGLLALAASTTGNGKLTRMESMREALLRGDSPNLVDNRGNTALHLLFASGGPDIVACTRMLILFGADVDIENNDGQRVMDTLESSQAIDKDSKEAARNILESRNKTLSYSSSSGGSREVGSDTEREMVAKPAPTVHAGKRRVRRYTKHQDEVPRCQRSRTCMAVTALAIIGPILCAIIPVIIVNTQSEPPPNPGQ